VSVLFPTMLYKSPGIYTKPGGGTYSFIGIQTQEEFDEKLAAGWFTSSGEAITAAGDKATPPSKPKPKWMLKATKKKKPAKPLDWREKAKETTAKPAPEPLHDNAPPTRAELEAKATQLALKFDGRTSDKKLGQLITKKLGE